MANPEHVEILWKGSETWNQWRKINPKVYPQLRGANLQNAPLNSANLTGANCCPADLSGANFHNADLSDANLFGADLSGAILSVSALSRANLSEANLSGANLRMATVYRTNLSGANLLGADLNGATFYATQLGNIDLSSVQGIETIKHLGPSTIGIDTFFLSRGRIPEVFLRGCGVPQDFITYMRSLVVNPVEYNSCFISYSHKDEDFARRLYSELRDRNLRVWYAPEEMKGGEKLHNQIEEAIQVHDRLLLILSEHSMGSEWVKTEIYNARQREIKEKRRILFPIALVPFSAIKEWKFFDADTGKDLAREVREYYIPSFSQWKDHDAFQSEFAKLLRDLQAVAPTGTPF